MADDVSNIKSFRIGKDKPAENERPRLLKVLLTRPLADQIIGKAHKLRTGKNQILKNIYSQRFNPQTTARELRTKTRT